MQNISHLRTKRYIFPAMVRKYYKVGGLLALVGLLGFALFMLGVGLKQDFDKIPCFAIAIIFGMMHVGCLIIWIKDYPIIDATYSIDDLTACNRINRLDIQISILLDTAIQKEVLFTFNFGYASLNKRYVVYSDNVLPEIDMSNIYRMVKTIWKSGSVIVPESDY